MNKLRLFAGPVMGPAVCLLGTLLMTLGCVPEPDRPPNVILIVLDTVRADRIGCYGYDRPTTPHIDALCARGIRFENASSTSSWTLPAHASIFTGLFPIRHGATQEHVALEEGASTLATLLASQGYATLGVSANPVVSRRSGLAQGFSRWEQTWGLRARAHPTAEHANLGALRSFLRENGPEQPFFAFLNYVEAHSPYRAPEPYRSRFITGRPSASRVRSLGKQKIAALYLEPSEPGDLVLMSDLYDGEIAYVDALIGEVVAFLQEQGTLENTLLIVTSDHGENFGDHGHFKHVFSLYGSTVRVPLIVLVPEGGRASEVIPEAVSLLDLFATILQSCGVAVPLGQREGRDLLGDLRRTNPPVFAEYYYPLQVLDSFDEEEMRVLDTVLSGFKRRLRSVEAKGRRLIWSSEGGHQLFDLRDDPAEQRNLLGSPEAAEIEVELRGLLDDFVQRGGGEKAPPPSDAAARSNGGFGDLDPQSRERLKELGYLR